MSKKGLPSRTKNMKPMYEVKGLGLLVLIIFVCLGVIIIVDATLAKLMLNISFERATPPVTASNNGNNEESASSAISHCSGSMPVPQQYDKATKSCPAPTLNRHGGFSAIRTNESSIAFLFVIDKLHVAPEDVWEAWFPPRQDARYHIYIHTYPSTTKVGGGNITNLGEYFCPYAIPSVPTEYRFIHEAQMALLKHAYHFSDATHFIFMSPTSIPLWSFEKVYRKIRGLGDESRFCHHLDKNYIDISPAWHVWKDSYKALNLDKTYLRKANTWSLLSRKHVEVILDREFELRKWDAELYRVFKGGNSSAGVPDETLIPTMLAREGYSDLEYCDQDERHQTECCVAHYVQWHEPGAVDEIPVTSHCDSSLGNFGTHPCGLSHLLEPGLDRVARDYMFIRKVALHAVVELSGSGGNITYKEWLRRKRILRTNKHLD